MLFYEKDDKHLWSAENIRFENEESIKCPHCGHRGGLRLAFTGRKKDLPSSKYYIVCNCYRRLEYCECKRIVPIECLFEYAICNS